MDSGSPLFLILDRFSRTEELTTLKIPADIDPKRLPHHVAVIMDGNGRWAKMKNKPRVFGHRNGVKSVREITTTAAEMGIRYLTLYAFSTENWNRPKLEVSALMGLLVDTLKNEMQTLNKNRIRLNAIGDVNALPKRTRQALLKGIEDTAHNDHMTLTLALNYSSRWEISDAVRKIAEKVKAGEIQPEEVNEDLIRGHLSDPELPDPELLIRTSGEHRISNYLLFQLAYTELYFTPVFWPDFGREEFYNAIRDFQKRERRFGKTSEQLQEH